MTQPDMYGLPYSIYNSVQNLHSDALITIGRWSSEPDLATFDVSVPVIGEDNRIWMESSSENSAAAAAAALLSVYVPDDGFVSYALIPLPEDQLQPEDYRVAVEWFGRPLIRNGDGYFGRDDVADPDREHFLAFMLDVQPNGITRLSGLIEDEGMVQICEMPALRSDLPGMRSVGLELANVMSSVLRYPPSRMPPTYQLPQDC